MMEYGNRWGSVKGGEKDIMEDKGKGERRKREGKVDWI